MCLGGFLWPLFAAGPSNDIVCMTVFLQELGSEQTKAQAECVDAQGKSTHFWVITALVLVQVLVPVPVPVLMPVPVLVLVPVPVLVPVLVPVPIAVLVPVPVPVLVPVLVPVP